jgi:DNA-binding response OmpR family regulator
MVPFAPEELLARVLALLRSSASASTAWTPVITVGDLHIDILNRTVRAGGAALRLTPLELGLMYLLAANTAEYSRARRFWTHSGARTTEFSPGVWTSRSETCERGCRRLVRSRGTFSTVTGRGYRFLPAGAA